ncbi:hypothetical protein G7Z17_g4661 [Cylindrodendrum hubeiense]|uniref:DUF221-domain-containing protein n=1 Tax=Cylindrodendrum hubeiense TaxID=595255 RepID=A0A9P5LIN9_9HYPO|nr:hypothetical protein G7Z17_g4661 [Cylindrodendrum hubeiense]
MTSFLAHLVRRLEIKIDTSDDPRTGSARDGSDGGTLSTSSSSKSSSLASLGATFIPVAVYAAVCLLLFTFLRPKARRVYSPRANAGLRSPHIPTPTLPTGWFNWIKPFWKIPDTFILNHGSIDGFFFLRYLKVLRNIFFVGICISWPVLFPVHITGGNGLEQLELLTIGNVKEPKLLFAHVAVAWVYFGFVLFTISRECIYYINIRQAYLSSPHYANRLSSRTVLLTSVPNQYLDEARLRKLYGDSVKRVWIPRTSKSLVKLVKEREQTAIRLEKAEIELIKKANIARTKQLRKAPPTTSSTTDVCEPPSPTSFTTAPDIDQTPDIERLPSAEQDEPETARRIEAGPELGSSMTEFSPNPNTFQDPLEKMEDPDYVHPYGLDPDLPDVRGSVAAQWIPVTARPHHRPLANYGRRVDTIRWCRTRLKDLNLEIFKLRRQMRRGDGAALPAAFIEFDSQESAQAAHQVVAHHRPLQMAPRILGIRPDEVVWSALRMRWWERIIRRFLIMGLVTVGIIFWAVPSAFIGIISNISFLATNIFFLKWLILLPKPILGFLQGFVPAIALSFWMSLVPAMLRACATQAGVPSLVLVELFTQNAYFAFQVVQVFLITTLTSAASAAFMDILKNPVSAKDLLAQNLPKASNFYLSYILVQCLAVGATGILHIFELLRQFIFSKIAQVPRARFNVWYNLRPPRWGALSYACIAPLVLAFACAGMSFVGLIYRYNILYVFDSELDTKGLFYPRALLQIIVGLYMAEICLVGLFALKFAFGPMVMMLMFFVFTGLVHLSLIDAITPLLQNLPQTLSLEEQLQDEEKAAEEARKQSAAESGDAGGTANDYYDTELAFGEGDFDALSDVDDDGAPHPTDRAVEGASGMGSAIKDWLKSSAKSKMKTEAEESGLMRFLNKLGLAGNEEGSDQPPSFLKRWMHPEIYNDFLAMRKLIPDSDLPDTEYPEDHSLSSYWPPELWLPKPVLWIPRDEARVSRQEVAHTKKFTPITDHGTTMNEKGLVVVDVEAAPFPRHRLVH